jgi:hypothetical protein
MDKIIACTTRRVSVEKIKELTWIIKKNEKGKKKKKITNYHRLGKPCEAWLGLNLTEFHGT